MKCGCEYEGGKNKMEFGKTKKKARYLRKSPRVSQPQPADKISVTSHDVSHFFIDLIHTFLSFLKSHHCILSLIQPFLFFHLSFPQKRLKNIIGDF